MPTFNMAAQTPNGQPGGTDTTVYTNGIPQTYPGRKYQSLSVLPYSICFYIVGTANGIRLSEFIRH